VEDDWLQILVEEARSRIQSGRRFHLAQVSSVLRNRGVDTRDVLGGRKLLEYLQTEAPSRIAIVKDQRVEGGWYIVPPDTANDFQELPPPPPVSSGGSTTGTRRFVRPFWTAFIKRMPDGCRRFVENDGSRFQNVPRRQPEPPNSIEITPGDLADGDLLTPMRLYAALAQASRPAREAARLPASHFHALPGATLTCLELIRNQPHLQSVHTHVWRDGLHLIATSEYERAIRDSRRCI
jgi:hypothetical protein